MGQVYFDPSPRELNPSIFRPEKEYNMGKIYMMKTCIVNISRTGPGAEEKKP